MKLIIKQYLASLKERDELDVILPDLLSQLGLNVFSRPKRGTRQYGVDVAAVGSLDGKVEKVYLFSIKSGDLKRDSWNGETSQALRPSLDEIQDGYIPSHLPNEHKDKAIVICLCFGGDIREEVRLQVEGYITQNTSDKIAFEKWNGDKLANLILTSFLHENLLPDLHSQLRKSLALLDEPEASYRHFSKLVKTLSSNCKDNKEIIKRLRQINICLWILFSWARDAGNIEAAYLASEFSVLHAWQLAKTCASKVKKSKAEQEILNTFQSIVDTYERITVEYGLKIIPHVSKRHAISNAVHSQFGLDVNLKLFDVLGRLSVWGIWMLLRMGAEEDDKYQKLISFHSEATKQFIFNNPELLLPIKDSQVIDISVAVLFFLISGDTEFVKKWLLEMVQRADFSYLTRNHYPCNISKYSQLVEHVLMPNKGDDYFQEVTQGSILFPMIALWAALLEDGELYQKVQMLKENHLKHCNFQLCFPEETSEKHFYLNDDIHGTALCEVWVERSMDEFLKQIQEECQYSHFDKLSAIESKFALLIIMACRHYRLPLPANFFIKFFVNDVSK